MRTRNKQWVAERLAALQDGFAKLALPLTIQRRAVYEVLLERDDHPSADDVHAAVEERLPGVSKATVYRTLDTLVELGLAERVGHPGSSARYDALLERHHHLVCDACGKITDVHSPSLDQIRLPSVRASGFVVRDFSVHIRGLCEQCSLAERDRSDSVG